MASSSNSSSAAMENFVSNVIGMTSSGSYADLASLCRRAVKDVLPRNIQYIDNALTNTLSLQHHSMGILAMLIAKLNHALHANLLDVVEAVTVQLGEFVSCCNGEQMRMIPDMFTLAFQKLADYYLLKKREPERPISLIIKAIDRLSTGRHQLTSLHATLCCLCLKSKILKPAITFLDVDITDILKERKQQGPQHIDTKSYLCYYYYGGMIYATLKMFDRALYFFEIVLSTQAVAVSAIMVEAYKKYLLVALIDRGFVPSLPAYRSPVVQRIIKQSCDVYSKLTNIYTGIAQVDDKAESLRHHLNQHRQLFEQDSNVGLIKQVITSLYKRSIQRLTKTFLTLSLEDVANRCRLDGGAVEAERYLVLMIESGEIAAKIDQQNGMVHFRDPAAQIDSVQLNEQMEHVMRLDKLICRLDKEIRLNPQYVNKSGKSAAMPFSSQAPILHDDEGVSVQPSNISAFSSLSDVMNV